MKRNHATQTFDLFSYNSARQNKSSKRDAISKTYLLFKIQASRTYNLIDTFRLYKYDFNQLNSNKYNEITMYLFASFMTVESRLIPFIVCTANNELYLPKRYIIFVLASLYAFNHRMLYSRMEIEVCSMRLTHLLASIMRIHWDWRTKIKWAKWKCGRVCVRASTPCLAEEKYVMIHNTCTHKHTKQAPRPFVS